MKYIFSEAQKLEILKCAHEVDKLVQLFKKVHGTLVFSSSLPPISWSSREGGDSVGHHGRIPPLEQHPWRDWFLTQFVISLFMSDR